MIESAATCKAVLEATQEPTLNSAAQASTVPTEVEVVCKCNYCEKTFDTYEKAATHEKGCGEVDEATPIPGEFTLGACIISVCTHFI